MPTWHRDLVNEGMESLSVRMDGLDASSMECVASFNLEGVDPERYLPRIEPTLEEMEPGQYVNVAIYREDADHLFRVLEGRERFGYDFLDHCGCGGDIFRVARLPNPP